MEYEIELYHHGTKGMRWGIRRYQNKDGSLTPAGKKRRAKLEGELKKLHGVKDDTSGGKAGSSSGKKSVSEMTNEELKKHTERMNVEKNYYEAQTNLAKAIPPQQVSKGKKLAEKFFNDTVLPKVGEAAKSVTESYLKKVLGLETKDELATLKRTFDILDYKTKIDKINNPDKYLSYEERTKKFKLEEDKRKSEEEYQKLKNAEQELEKVRKELDEERKKNRTDQGDS